jgi:hypothetical protein
MQPDPSTTVQKRSSVAGLFILVLAVIAALYFTYRQSPDRRSVGPSSKDEIGRDDHYLMNDEHDLTDRPETGELDF